MTWVNLKQLCGGGGITKGCEKTFGSDGFVHYLDYANGFTGVYVCQNLSVYLKYAQFIVQ